MTTTSSEWGTTGWRRGLRGLLLVLALILIVGAFLPLRQTDLWWVRMLDFPRLQLAGIGIIVFLLYYVSEPHPGRGRSVWILSMLGIATVWQLVHTIRYLPFWPREIASVDGCPAEQRLSLLGVNVLTPNDRYQDTLDMIGRADADVVLLTESDRMWEAAMHPIHDKYPYRLGRPLDNLYGMHLYSRLPFTGELLARVQPDIPSIKGQLTLRNGQKVTLHGLHPEPPQPGDNAGERDAELILVGREVRDDGGAALVLGDLNDVAWSPTSRLFLEASGMNDPRVGRRLLSTFNAKWPLMRWPLDHLFASPHFSLIEMKRMEKIGSDHFPVLFHLCLTDNAEERLVAPEAPDDTEEEASEQLREGATEAVIERRGKN
ncbi:endonuclease/exonuclease/phosphatase family protein [Sphingomicrobium lutaoense]|uniref:Endonuclease/exonuclease/phosphatase (EEP) superfamily protein YafD n=1 Tax=Sphingomicrobium lutaoense TaxID=515949 RepID=A0A839Z160_9SPHN|nr:endonuclease/exonuclease/phosphatase family protein [Sphingomicrobium lutaoense]MBB3763423.1 endonuclease/exonuclease/phosphatase (EEP) superfamily protein YafD [Sphingomicrobium lutaoense]